VSANVNQYRARRYCGLCVLLPALVVFTPILHSALAAAHITDKTRHWQHPAAGLAYPHQFAIAMGVECDA